MLGKCILGAMRAIQQLLPAILVTAAAISVPAFPADAASTWNGSSGNWSDPSRWLNNIVPDDSSKDAIINGGSPLLDQNFTIRNLSLGGGSLQASGTNQLTLAGLLTWTGGSIASGATVNLTSATGASLISNAITNAGTIGWSAGSVSFSSGAALTSSGTIDATGTGKMYPISGAANLTNNGTFHRRGSGASTLGVAFDNNGTVTVDAGGSLILTGGGSAASTCVWSVASGGTLAFGAGNFFLASGSSLSNSGAITVADGFSLYAADFAGKHLVMNGQELLIHGDLPSDGGTTGFKWTNGILCGAGTTLNTDSIAFTSNASSWGVRGGRTIENAGAITWSGGIFGARLSGTPSFSTSNDGIITNDSGATIQIKTSAGWGNPLSPADLVINNAGSIAFDSAASGNVYARFNNQAGGQVGVSSGTVLLQAGGTSGGSFSVASGATLGFVGDSLHALGSTSYIGGAGNVIFDRSSVDVSGTIDIGSVAVGPTAAATVHFKPGANVTASSFVTGNATVDLDSGASIHATTFTGNNSSTTNFGGTLGVTGTLHVNGGALNIAPSASVNLGDYSQSGGTLFLNGATVHVAGASTIDSANLVGHGALDASSTSITSSLLGPGGDDNPVTGVLTGALAFTGDLSLDAASALLVKVDVSSAVHSNDLIDIGGTGAFGGSFLLVRLIGDPSQLSAGESFTIVHAGNGVSGGFNGDSSFTGVTPVYDSTGSDVIGQFDISGNTNAVILQHFIAVPEPSGLLVVFMLGAVPLLRRLRLG